MRSAAFAFVLVASALFNFGCAKSKNRANTDAAGSTETYYAVTAKSANFYRYGPQQGTGPDRKLPRDTLMTLARRSFGYARVRLTTGEEGYVASEDIRVAEPALVAAAFPTPTPAPRLFAEPQLPSFQATPAVEPTAIPAPSASPQ